MSSSSRRSHDNEIKTDSENFNYKYKVLKDTTQSNLQKGCLNRWPEKRSSWDRMQKEWLHGARLDLPMIQDDEFQRKKH